jgi:glucose-6-phosphate dehydrogenase assembly protein OpcA
MQVPDVIYVDSLKIKNGIKAVAEIHDSCRKLIDLNWVRLSGFRDSIRIGFDLFNNTASLHKLNKVIISSLVDPSDTHSDSSSKLLAGWIKSMLNTINLEFKFNHHNFEKYSHIPGLLPGSICSVEFKGEDNISIVVEVIQSGNLIIKCVQDNNNCSFNRTSEYNSNLEVSSAALLKRMILVGESQRNFRSALLSALTL